MKKLPKIRVLLIFITVILGIIYSIPNFINISDKDKSIPFLPGKSINLGLDLKGGSYLLLKANMDIVFSEKLEIIMSEIFSKKIEDRL